MTRRYDFQDVLDRFASSQSQRFRELSDAIARRVLELLGGGTVPNDPPGAPSGLTASTDQEFRVVLDWSPVAGATGYNVYRAPIGGTSFAQIGVASTSDYIDVGLPAETSYRYYVTAYNSSGESGPSSTEIGTTANGAAPPLPDVPANFQVLDSVDTVTLGWDAFTGGTVLCRIERSSNQTDWTVIANTGSVTFNDANVTVGATLYYRAYGVSATGVTSVSTPTLTVVVSDGDTTAPPVPVITNTTTANKAIFVEWESVVASDLAGYEIGYGTSSGVYTDTTPLLTGSSAFVTGLTNATQYYFAIRSVDSSLNQNKSAWSNEKFNTPIDQAFPNTPDGPGVPTDLVFSSPERNQVRVNFTPGVTESPRRHRLYARVKPGYLINGAPPTTAWTQIDQEPHPATVLGKDATIFVGSNSFEQSPVVWQFYVTAVDTYNQESSPSEIVEGQLDGAAWNQGPGSGPIAGGNFNGDQLTPEHRVPGYTFDYIIDVSDPAAYTGDAMERAAAIFNNRRGLAPTNPDYLQLSTTDRASIAILLPNETVNRRLEINTGATGNADIEVAEFDFGGDPGFESLVDLHLVAPWDDANATVVDAQAAMRDDPLNFTLGYKRTFKNADNTSKFADGQGYNIKIGDSTRRDAKVDMWFWNWDIEVSGASGVLAGSNADTGADFKSHDFWVGFGLCRFHQDNVLPNNNRIGSHAIDARYAKIELGGTYIDMPWQDGSAVRCLSTLRGDFGITNVRVRRSGGSAFEFYTRSSRDANLPSGTDAGTLTINGIRHWDETPGLDDGIGRASSDGVYFFDFGGLEQDVAIFDAQVIQENPSNFRSIGQWPPSDPYDWRVYTDFVRQSHSAIRVWDKPGTRSRSDGFKHGDLTITNSNFYTKYPKRPVIDIETAKTVTLDDVGAFTGETIEMFTVDSSGNSVSAGQSTTVGYKYAGSGTKPAMAPYAIGAMDAADINTAAKKADLNTTYGIAAQFVAASVAGLVFDTYEVTHFDVNTDHSWLSYTPPANPFDQPVGLIPVWPSVANFSALDDMLGLTRRQAKTFILPGMRAGRTGRTQHSGGTTIRTWKLDASEPGGVLVDIAGDTITHTVSPDKATITFANMEEDTVGVPSFTQKIYFSNYTDRSQYDTIPLVSPGPADDPNEARAVLSRQYYTRPAGANVVFDNVGVSDDKSYYKTGIQNGPPPTRVLKWGARMNAMPQLTFSDCDFEYIHEEHGVYTNMEGPILVENCTFRHTSAQGFQTVHRNEAKIGELTSTGAQKTGENHAYDPLNPPSVVFRNSHFVDCGSYARDRGRSSSSLTLQDGGYPTIPCTEVTIEDCTFVAGLDPDEAASNTGSSTIPQDGRYRYTIDQSSANYQTSGEIRVGIEGGYFRNKIHVSGVDMATVAAGRDDDSAAIYKKMDVKNTYIHAKDNDKALLNLDSIRNIVIEDSVIIQEIFTATAVLPGITVDSDLYKARTERGTVNPHYLGGQKLIFRNCYGVRKDYRTGTLVTSPITVRVYDAYGNTAWLEIGDLRGREVEYALYYADGQIRTSAQVDAPIYDGAVRPGYVPT
jgi:fibronectin type 3 domain-containing protein